MLWIEGRRRWYVTFEIACRDLNNRILRIFPLWFSEVCFVYALQSCTSVSNKRRSRLWMVRDSDEQCKVLMLAEWTRCMALRGSECRCSKNSPPKKQIPQKNPHFGPWTQIRVWKTSMQHIRRYGIQRMQQPKNIFPYNPFRERSKAPTAGKGVLSGISALRRSVPLK